MWSAVMTVIGAITAVGLEVVYRQSAVWPVWAVVPALVVTWGVYSTLHSAPSLLSGIALFQAVVLLARLAASHWLLHEPLRGANLVVALLLITAFLVGKFWR